MKTDSIFKRLFYNNKIKILGVTFCILLISLIFMITKPKKINEQVQTSKLETNKSKKTSENNSKPTIENKTTKNKAFLFTIAEKNANFNEDFYDAINKSLKCNGKTYFVGGSTDIGFPPEHDEFKTFLKLKSEIRIVLDTLKPY